MDGVQRHQCIHSLWVNYNSNFSDPFLLVFGIFVKNWRVVFRKILVCLLGFVVTLPLFVYFLRQQIQNLLHNFIIPKLSVRELINFVNWMNDTFLFSLACWPYSLLPKWIGQLVVSMVFVVGVFVVVHPYLKEGSKTIIGLIIAYTFYYVFVRTGLYGTHLKTLGR